MLCPYCREKELSDQAKFCPKCGHKLPRCPGCDVLITRRQKFCSNCGSTFSEELLALIDELPEEAPVQKPPERRFCRQCGAICEPGETLCADCRQKAAVTAPPPKKKRSPLPVIFGVILAVLLLVGVGWGVRSMLNRDAASADASQTEEAQADSSGAALEIGVADYEPEPDESTDDTDAESAAADGSDEDADQTAQTSAEEETETQDVETPAFVFPDSATSYLTEEDLEGLTAEQCQIARNEIYARHGRKFKDETLQAYFDACDWYEGTVEPDDFDESVLNEYEIANRDLIVAFEEEQGYR